jgi:hypothetical protein
MTGLPRGKGLWDSKLPLIFRGECMANVSEHRLVLNALTRPRRDPHCSPAVEIARGAARLLSFVGFASVSELPLPNGRRADLVGLSETGEIWIVEIKSCVEDLKADLKWTEYRAFCDRLFFAVDQFFPRTRLPADTGIIIADRYGGEIVRGASVHKLTSARRKCVALRFARVAASRLLQLGDPEASFERVLLPS